MTTLELDKLAKTYNELYLSKYAGYAAFMLGLLHKTKAPVKLSLLFIQTKSFYQVDTNNLEIVKQTFLNLKNLGVLTLSNKVDAPYASLTQLGRKIVHLTEQSIIQNCSSN